MIFFLAKTPFFPYTRADIIGPCSFQNTIFRTQWLKNFKPLSVGISSIWIYNRAKNHSIPQYIWS